MDITAERRDLPEPSNRGLQSVLEALEAPTEERRQQGLQSLLVAWEIRWRADERSGLHYEAALHAPRMAHRLAVIEAEQTQLAMVMQQTDPRDESSARRLASRVRDHVRRHAALIAEIWYDEIGGEG